VSNIKRLVYSKMQTLSSFALPNVVPNL